MSGKRYELYLLAFALVVAASLILYVALAPQPLSAMGIPLNNNATLANLQDEENVLSQTQSPASCTAFQPEESATPEQGTHRAQVATQSTQAVQTIQDAQTTQVAAQVTPATQAAQITQAPQATETAQADAVTTKLQKTTVAPKLTGPVNINTATKDQLITLNGIGEVKAAAIIDYRQQNGDFYTVDELVNVKGIGEKTLEKIRANVKV